MPVISMFYGIIIRPYLIDSHHHNLAHIHAKYAEFEASVSIDDGEFWLATCRGNSCGSCKRGSSFTVTS